MSPGRRPTSNPLLEAIDQCDHVIGCRPAREPRKLVGIAGLAGAAADFRCPAAGRSFAVPSASARQAGGDPPAVGVVVRRHRDPRQGDLSRPSDRRGRRSAARAASRGSTRLVERLDRRFSGIRGSCDPSGPAEEPKARTKVTTAQAARISRDGADVEQPAPRGSRGARR